MSQPKNSPETVRQPRSIAVKFVIWLVVYLGIVLILSLSSGGFQGLSPVEFIFPVLVAAVIAYLSRPESQRVTIEHRNNFIDAVKKSLARNYTLAKQTDTLLYFKPTSKLGQVFNDVILVEMDKNAASLTGEQAAVKKLQKELIKAGVANWA